MDKVILAKLSIKADETIKVFTSPQAALDYLSNKHPRWGLSLAKNNSVIVDIQGIIIFSLFEKKVLK